VKDAKLVALRGLHMGLLRCFIGAAHLCFAGFPVLTLAPSGRHSRDFRSAGLTAKVTNGLRRKLSPANKDSHANSTGLPEARDEAGGGRL
jgi:hypothetical protein